MPKSGPARTRRGRPPCRPPSMHPHLPTLTHLHMSTRLTLIHPDCHLLGKIHFNLRSVRRTATLHPRNQIWILARTLAVLPFHTGENWLSVHNPTEPRGRRRSETLLSQWKSTHLAAPRTTSHATRRRPAPGNAVVHCRLTSQPATCVPLPLNTFQAPLAFLRWLNTPSGRSSLHCLAGR